MAFKRWSITSSDIFDSNSLRSKPLQIHVDILQENIYSSVDVLHKMTTKSELLQGTLDLLILKTLDTQPMHGFGIAQRIQQVSGEVFQVNQGSLYPALHRLEQKGLIEPEWKITENNRKAKYYRLTASGRKRLQQEEEQWKVLSAAIARVLEAG